MSLEQILEKNTAALESHAAVMERHTTILEKLFSAQQAKGGAAAATDDASEKPAATRGRKPKADAGAAKGGDDEKKALTLDDVKPRLTAWLTEFASADDEKGKPSKDPEVDARKAALKKAFAGLGCENLTGVGDVENGFDRLSTWLDKRIAEGRSVPLPEPDAGAASDDDDLDI